jgi:hypothetical protein
VNPLPIAPHLAIKNCIFISGEHLGLGGHLGLPPFDGLQLLALFREGGVDDGNDLVDALEAEALPVFAWAGELPGNFPVGWFVSWVLGRLDGNGQGRVPEEAA